METDSNYLSITKKLFHTYKTLADKAMQDLNEQDIHFQANSISNSIAILVKHLSGNMLSRFTDFLSSDGEKEWRERDAEFEDSYASKQEMLAAWEKGWACLFATLESLTPDNLSETVYIRKEGHTVLEAISRQLAHYASHVGQILYIGKMIQGDQWKYLSIPPGKSKDAQGEFLK